jgi:hypothetical protein
VAVSPAIIANPIKGLTAIITAPITVSVSLTTSISILVPIWQDNDIVELNDQGKWVVNAPTIAFNDIGDLFNADDHFL